MSRRKTQWVARALAAMGTVFAASQAYAGLVTDPNDPRTWQGAGVGTFAQLYFGSDTPATRQMVVDQTLLDDGLFNFGGYTAASLVHNAWSDGGGGGPCIGTSFDLTGIGDYNYGCGGDLFTHANSIDNRWFQSSPTVGNTVFDFGFPVSFAAVFPAIDHGPIPQEAIESTVYLSNDQMTWVQADVKRVFLEGFQPNLGILWDGFTYVVGTANGDFFRYASIINGGPGALQHDGDDEINGIMGLYTAPEPGTMSLLALAGIAMIRKSRR